MVIYIVFKPSYPTILNKKYEIIYELKGRKGLIKTLDFYPELKKYGKWKKIYNT